MRNACPHATPKAAILTTIADVESKIYTPIPLFILKPNVFRSSPSIAIVIISTITSTTASTITIQSINIGLDIHMFLSLLVSNCSP